MRRLVVGDNLESLSRQPSESATLAYLDPPFNSGRGYEARIGRPKGSAAFSDVWSWDDRAEEQLRRLREHLNDSGSTMVRVLVDALGKAPMSAYLVHLAPRLGEVHRALARDGSLYLHCDTSGSHYLKVVLDSIFGAENFRNEIVWRRTHAHSGSRRFGPVHDVILFYTKTKDYVWNQGYSPYSEEYLRTYFRQEDERGRFQAITCTAPGDREGTLAHYEWKGQWPPPGRHWCWTMPDMQRLEAEGRLVYSRTGVPRLKRYVHDGNGVRLQDVWSDLPPLSAHSAERVGYDTQKPVALIERILAASTRPGDLVLDPYCGSGTTAVAAERMSRSWEVHDVSLLAGSMTLARIRDTAPGAVIETEGLPSNEREAVALRSHDDATYGAWATAMLAAALDRRSQTRSVAVGLRSWSPSFLGLVPLGTPAELPGRARQHGTVLVVDGPDSADLVARMRRLGAEDVQRVPLAALTSRVASSHGLAEFDLRLAA